MRFVRAYTDPATGALLHVIEQERPFDDAHRLWATKRGADGADVCLELETHELGLVDHFVPKTLAGEPCTHAEHLFQRLERHPDAWDHAAENLDRPAAAQFRARPGHEHEVPDFFAMPTTLEGIKAKLRTGGPQSLHGKARAWLAYILEPHESDALGVSQGIPLSVLKSLDALRVARDPQVGSRRHVLERATQERSDDLALRHHVRRRAVEAKDLARHAAQRIASVEDPARRKELEEAVAALEHASRLPHLHVVNHAIARVSAALLERPTSH